MRGAALVLGALSLGTVVAIGCAAETGSGQKPLPVDDPSPGPGPSEEFPGGPGPGVPVGPPPDLGSPVTAEVAPPPISGGTLRVLADGKTAVASDPDRDRIYLVDLASQTVRTLILTDFDEPGRIAEDSKGNVHVVLRRGGGIVDVDVAAGTFARRDACAAPRGIAFDAKSDLLHVACMGGELVSLPSSGGSATRTLKLEKDLRDVVVTESGLLVTRFRSAQILNLDASGTIVNRAHPFVTSSLRSPAVAWRAVPVKKDPDPQGMVVVHQNGQDDPVNISTPNGYGGGGGGGIGAGPCTGIVQSAVSFVGNDGMTKWTVAAPQAVLPVDVAVSGNRVVVVAAGNAHSSAGPMLLTAELAAPTDPCAPWGTISAGGEAVAVDYAGTDIVVQSRQPAFLQVISGSGTPKTIPLSDIDRNDTGHRIFHANSGAQIACASCHPEGGDDGRVWSFDTIGRRRTQTFRGGLLGTEPFHWDGDQRNLGALVDTVFVRRMGGPHLDDAQLATLAHWIDRVPSIPHPAPADKAAVASGDALFHDPDVGCSSCHAGSALTNNKTFDVGTGGNFQVPSLRGVGFRAPYLHNGCAPTLTERFTSSCSGGDAHGKTSTLTSDQIANLVAYLETL